MAFLEPVACTGRCVNPGGGAVHEADTKSALVLGGQRGLPGEDMRNRREVR